VDVVGVAVVEGVLEEVLVGLVVEDELVLV
jgi:hypothetical protein